MKRMKNPAAGIASILLAFILTLILSSGAMADPARTDGTVTAWIGEGNELFLKCTDGITRKLSVPMKDILDITDTDAVGLTQANQIVAVKKDGSNYSILSADATEEEIAGVTNGTVRLEEGRLSVGDSVFSERAAAATSDGLMLYWVNRNENGFVLMQKELPGKEQEASGRSAVSLTGRIVPEPLYMCVTEEALTITCADRSIVTFGLKTGEYKSFPASGFETTGACLAGERLYRYYTTEQIPWVLEDIQNDAMKLVTVTPAPTVTPTVTMAPTATWAPTITPRPTVTPRPTEDDGSIHYGARGRTVRKIQQRLAKLGYPVGYVDGVYGEQTQIAVNLFYDALNMRERSYISQLAYRKLFAKDAPEYDPYLPLRKGNRGLSVLYMQIALKQAGFDPVKIDGVYGELTIQAVAAYQQAIGYIPAEKEKPGEYASRELLEKLYGPEPTFTPEPTATPTTVPTATPTTAPTNTPEPATPTDL